MMCRRVRLIGVALTVPWLMIVFIGTVLVDRWNRRADAG